MSTGLRKKALSAAICGIMAGAISTTAQAQDSTELIEEIEVVGVKSNLMSAQELKRNANTVVDVITADDIGSLPDRSVTEALQRIPGITIERFDSPTDPNHGALEGAGVVVRGLSRVRAEFNGRDTFSAGNGGGLNFQNVPPELLGAIEVSKNHTANMISGGMAGTVNLITRKPFDSDEMKISLNAKGTHADFGDDDSQTYSGLFSDSWETDSAGKFGFLISVSDGELKARTDGVGLDNYYLRNPGSPNIQFGEPEQVTALNARPGEDVWVPGGLNLNQTDNVSERKGLTTSLQWESPNEMVVATAEYISSKSDQSWRERAITRGEQGYNYNTSDQLLDNGADAVFDGGGVFVSGSRSQSALYARTRINEVQNDIEDLSFHLTIKPSDRLTIDLDAQRIEGEKGTFNWNLSNYGVGGAADQYLNLAGSKPQTEFLGLADIGTAAGNDNDAFIRTASGTQDDAEAESTAFQVDVEYEFDDSWITSVEGGAYYSDRDQTVRDQDYSSWGSVSNGWAGIQSSVLQHPELHDRVDLGDTFGGGVVTGDNTSIYFPKFSLVENIAGSLEQGVADGWNNNGFLLPQSDPLLEDGYRPSQITDIGEQRSEVYAQVNWALDDLDMPLRGNFGLRYVNYEVESTGAVSFPEQAGDNVLPFLPADDIAFMSGAGTDRTTVNSDYDTLLPSFNISMDINEDWVARFAASKAVFYPTIGDLRNNGSVAASTTRIQDENGDLIGVDLSYVGFAQNPNLEPEKSTNYDLTLEWYFADVGSVTTSLFYKDLEDLLTDGIETRNVTSGGVTNSVDFNTPINGAGGTIQGIELAYTQFYDFLPGPLSGLGLQANYTYLDQQGLGDVVATGGPKAPGDASPGDQSNRSDFRNFSGLPLAGYSDETYNITAMYEKYDISARLAYNWRSGYMLAPNDSESFSPVYATDHGELDASIAYAINDNFTIGLEGSNLTDAEVETEVQRDQAGTRTLKNTFKKGRIYSVFLKANF